MSYRVVTGPAIPFVHALPSGLGFDGDTGGAAPAPSTWKEIVFQLSQPFAQAGAQRLAYGKTDPYYSPFGASLLSPGQSPYGYSTGGFGGISPTTLLLGGAALLAVMMLRK